MNILPIITKAILMALALSCVSPKRVNAGCVKIVDGYFLNGCREQVIIVFAGNTPKEFGCKINNSTDICGHTISGNRRSVFSLNPNKSYSLSWVECVGDKFIYARKDDSGAIKCFTRGNSAGPVSDVSKKNGNGSRMTPGGNIRLTGVEIRNEFIGKKLRGVDTADGRIAMVIFRSDGTASYNKGLGPVSGRWFLKGDQFCTEWSGNSIIRACQGIARKPDGAYINELGVVFYVQ